MVILINFNPQSLKVEYTDGNHSYFKALPSNVIVAMQSLKSISQISNKNLLVNKNVTVWEYETNTYLNHNASTPTGSTLPLLFVGNNKKPNELVNVAYGYSGATTISGMTFTKNNAAASTLYRIITSATPMTNGTLSVSGAGNNTTVYFSGASTTTQDVYGALTGSSFSGLGITMTGQGATKINTGGTVTFYISATTVDINSGYVFLQRMV